MNVPYVTDSQTGIRYQLDRALGQGATSQVWLGIPADTNAGSQVAVKLALAGTSPAELVSFEAELQLPELLAPYGADRFVPWIHRATVHDAPDTFGMIIELVPDEWQLTVLARPTKSRLPEALALRSGVQFAQLLCALHTLKITMRGDRKATDLRWDEANQRLIVLDWNRAAPIPAQIPQSIVEDYLQQDLRVFGHIWSEFVLGRSINELPPVDGANDPLWETVSRGLRCILTRARSRRPDQRYASAIDLERDLSAHLRDFTAMQDGKIQQLLDLAENARSKENAEQVLNICDLIQRAQGEAGLQSLIEWAQVQLVSVERKVAQTVQSIVKLLELDQYEDALPVVKQAKLRLIEQEPQAHLPLLRLLRWEIATNAAIHGNKLGQPMRNAVAALRQTIDQLERLPDPHQDNLATLAKLQELGEQLDIGFASCPNAIRSLIRPLELEIELRKTLVRQLSSTAMKGGTELYAATVVALWQELDAIDCVYAGYLEVSLHDLADLIAQQQRADERERASADCIRELDRISQQIEELLGRSDPIWPDLSALFQQATTVMRGLRELQPTLLSDKEQVFQFFEHVDTFMRHRSIRQALAFAISADDSMPFKAVTQQKCILAACERVKELADKGAWMDELEEAEQLVILMRNNADVQRELQAEKGQLTAWRSYYTEYAPRFLTDPQQMLVSLSDPTKDPLIEEALEIALNRGIEVVDRRGLAADIIEQYRVANLDLVYKASRQKAAQTIELEVFVHRTREAAVKLNETATVLTKDMMRLRELLKHYNYYIQGKKKQSLDQDIENFQAHIHELDRMLSNSLWEEKSAQLKRRYEAFTHRFRKYQGNIEVQRKRMEQSIRSSRKDEEPFIRSLIDRWIIRGLYAAEELEIDKAQKYRDQIRPWESRLSDEEKVRVTQLDETINDLNWLYVQTEVWESLKAWQEALKQRDREGALAAYAALEAAMEHNPHQFAGWVVASLSLSHNNVCSDDAVQPTMPLAAEVAQENTVAYPLLAEMLAGSVDSRMSRDKAKQEMERLVAWWGGISKDKLQSGGITIRILNMFKGKESEFYTHLNSTHLLLQDAPLDFLISDWRRLKEEMDQAYSRMSPHLKKAELEEIQSLLDELAQKLND